MAAERFKMRLIRPSSWAVGEPEQVGRTTGASSPPHTWSGKICRLPPVCVLALRTDLSVSAACAQSQKVRAPSYRSCEESNGGSRLCDEPFRVSDVQFNYPQIGVLSMPTRQILA